MRGSTKTRTTRIALTSLLLVFNAFASTGALSQGLSVVETDELRLLYFDPTETYLVPRVIQTFHDSLDRQKSILDYNPLEKTTVLLTDFADYGNAGASANPRNSVLIDVAPIPFTFETTLPAERMYTFMNHEMVHVATMDQPAAADLAARRFFRGKVLATAEHPETILYQYLTSPRKSTPRWYLEGIAVFQETWMAGGLGRAQGGYDEMVFRSKVRDSGHFYDPLGLVAEGVRIDFQVGANAYLYGGRFMNYLAYSYTPDKLVEWVKRTDDSHRWYEKDFARVYGLSLNDAWQDWIEFEKDFQQKNLEQIREYPTTPYTDIVEGALGSTSRAFFDAQRNSLIAGVRYPGVLAHIGELSIATGKADHLEDVKVPMLYRVSSVAYDESAKTIFYTADNYAYRDLMAIDLRSGQSRMLMKDARIGEIVFNRADKSLWGVRHLHGYASLVRMPHPYTQWDLVHTLGYAEVAYDLDISPDGTLLSGSFGDVEGMQRLNIFRTDELLAGTFEPVQSFNFNQALPEGFVFSPDGKLSLFGSSYFHRRIQHLSLRARNRGSRGSQQRRNRFLPANSAIDNEKPDRLSLHGRGLQAGEESQRCRSRTSMPSRCSARRSSRITRSCSNGVPGRLTARRPNRASCTRALTHRSAKSGSSPCTPIVLGLQGLSVARPAQRISPTLFASRILSSALVTTLTATCRATNGSTSISTTRIRWSARRHWPVPGASARAATTPTSTTCSVRRRKAARAIAFYRRL